MWQAFKESLCTEVPGRTKRASGSPQVRTEDGNLVLAVNKLSHVSVKVGSDSVNLDEISADCDAKVAAVSASLTESVEQAAADVVDLRTELESSVNTKLEDVGTKVDEVAATVKSDLEPKIAKTEQCCAANKDALKTHGQKIATTEQALKTNGVADASLTTLVNSMKATLDRNVKTIADLSAKTEGLECTKKGLDYDAKTKKCTEKKTGEAKESAGVSCSTLSQENPGMKEGFYWVSPDKGQAFRVYCKDGWSLLMRITGNGGRHVKSNSAYRAPPNPSNGEARFSTTDITRFIKAPKVQVFKVQPDHQNAISWFQRADKDTDEWPTNLECNNRGNLLNGNGNKWKWIITSFQTYAGAKTNNGGDRGGYTGSNHYYPTPYGSQQLFFSVSAAGMRINDGWDSSCCWQQQGGTLWVTDA